MWESRYKRVISAQVGAAIAWSIPAATFLLPSKRLRSPEVRWGSFSTEAANSAARRTSALIAGSDLFHQSVAKDRGDPRSLLRLCRNLASFSGVPWDQMGRSESMPTCRWTWLVMDPSPNQRRPLRNQRTKTVVTHKGLGMPTLPIKLPGNMR